MWSENPRKIVCEKGYIWNPAKWSCENGRYAGSIIDDSMIMCDGIIETTKSILTKTVPAKSIPTNFNEEKAICKIKKSLYSIHLFINYHNIINSW